MVSTGPLPPTGLTQFIDSRTPRDRTLAAINWIKVRYVRAAFRHPELFVRALRRPDFSELLNRAEDLEFATPVMADMRAQSLRKMPNSFRFEGKELPYLCTDFNHAWGTERTVEVPIAWDRVQRISPDRVLEVGNVLAHYFPTDHSVVDKYEVGPRVINQDIVDFSPPEKFDLVVSISTLEHIGWDEFPRDRSKIPKTLSLLRSLLAPGGEAWVTVPVGYNRWLDRALADGSLNPARAVFLRRVSFDNRWVESRFEDVAHARYGAPIDRSVDRPPFPRANAIAVLVFRA
jgi:hypothetical protein